VFSFVDYVGKDKLHVFLTTSDKTNISGIYQAGFGLNKDGLNKFLTDLEDGKIKVIISAGFYPYQTYGNYKSYLNQHQKLISLLWICLKIVLQSLQNI